MVEMVDHTSIRSDVHSMYEQLEIRRFSPSLYIQYGEVNQLEILIAIKMDQLYEFAK